MKNLKKLKYLCLIGLLTVFTGCSNNRGEETTVPETNPIETAESETSTELESEEERETSKETESEESTTSYTETPSTEKISKQDYLDSLQYAYDLEESVTSFTDQPTIDKAADETYEAWDNELNKIYHLLMDILDDQDKEDLIQEELAWIESKEQEATAIGHEMEGSATQHYEVTMTNAIFTRKRTLALIDRYYEISSTGDYTITPIEAELLLVKKLGTIDETTGNQLSYGYEDTITIDDVEYHNFRLSWLILDESGTSHVSYLGQLLVTVDGSKIFSAEKNYDTGEWTILEEK